MALIISFVIGIAFGAIMAAFSNSAFTKVWTFLSSLSGAVPSYLVAIALIYLLADTYRVFPEGGAYAVGDTIGFNWPFLNSVVSHAFLPVLAYVLTSFGGWALGMKGSAMLGPISNYPTLGNYAGDRALGFGPVVDVPGLGKVSVSETIAKEYETVPPGSEMNALTYDWARLVDQQVPYIWYATKVYQFPFSTAHYTDFPPLNSKHTSPLWDILGEDMGPGLALAMEEGYIRPKS